MRYSFLSLFALAALAACTSVDRRSLADYDDGIYSWDPYPESGGYGYSSGGSRASSQGYAYYGDDGYNDGYEDGYEDAFYTFNGPYASPYFSYRPRHRRWDYTQFQYFPSYYYGYNTPYMYPPGFMPFGGFGSPYFTPWNDPFYNPYAMGGWGYPGYGYGNPYGYGGYGYGNPYGYGGYGYNGYGYGGFNPWGGMTGTTPTTGGSAPNPVNSNISMRRMNISGGPHVRRPRVENVAGRSSERPGTIEEGRGEGMTEEKILITPMRSIETHRSNPSRDEVGRTPNGTIHYANPPQRAEPRQPEGRQSDAQRPTSRRPDTEQGRTPPPTVRQPEVQRSAPRSEPLLRTYNAPTRQETSHSSERSFSEPSRATPSRSVSEPVRSSSPSPSRSTGGRGGR